MSDFENKNRYNVLNLELTPFQNIYTFRANVLKKGNKFSNKKRLRICSLSFIIWARRDSNPRPKDYESSALPLRHRPVAIIIFNFKSFLACAQASAFALPTSSRTILNRSRRQSATGPWQ